MDRTPPGIARNRERIVPSSGQKYVNHLLISTLGWRNRISPWLIDLGALRSQGCPKFARPEAMTTKTRLRSQQWFDNPDNPGMTALYLERYLNYGLTREELSAGKPIIGIAQTGSDLSPCNRHHLELAQARSRRHPRRRRHRVRVSGPSDPGNRQTADRGARPQSRLSRSRRGALRLSARRRRADDRLRQDHAGLRHGGGDRQPAGHRAVRRADAQWLVERRTRRLRHGGVVGAPGACRRPPRPIRNSWTSSPPRRRRLAIATPWALPRP